LATAKCFFLIGKFSFWKVLHIVASLTHSPVLSANSSQYSFKVVYKKMMLKVKVKRLHYGNISTIVITESRKYWFDRLNYQVMLNSGAD
jgi:hypothetical protein